MTFICESDLDIPKMYMQTENEVLGQGFQKLEHEQDIQTDRQTQADTQTATERI